LTSWFSLLRTHNALLSYKFILFGKKLQSLSWMIYLGCEIFTGLSVTLTELCFMLTLGSFYNTAILKLY
jgi:hypothetical protein